MNSLPRVDATASADERQACVSALDLLRSGLIEPGGMQDIQNVIVRYPIRVSSHVARLIDRQNPDCPLRRQFIPSSRELERAPGHSEDPLNESVHTRVPGLIHRYPDRALMQVSSSCGALCRFCFRKSLMRNRETVLHGDNWSRAMDYLARAKSVKEVILSGGDPLMLSDGILENLMRDLTHLRSIRRIRIHTRVPIVDPERITFRLIEALSLVDNLRIVVHANHPAELVAESLESLARLRRTGFELLSQSVLLRGVNDRSSVLLDLFSRLMGHGIQPYYLHHPDPACGTLHFSVPLFEGLALFRRTRTGIGKNGVPRYVVDLPGSVSKTEVENLNPAAYPEPVRKNLPSEFV